ncbi:MAG: UvrD-helicase domain-containing protein [Bacteroidales bacterium]|nr:UvrD-helicase domain-containing protein [Bacteroidales bacterium]
MGEDAMTGGGVKILKASAGSGKTYSLAREYIRLLLLDGRTEPRAYRGILALTFTNRATDEMKRRIIGELDILASRPEKSDYRDYLLAECGFESVRELQAAARKSLGEILEDYGSFSVSTIDRFFQRVLRAFAREAGQFSEYQIDLDRDSLVDEAVDRVLDSLSDGDDALRKWLSDSSLEDIRSGDGYRLERNLKAFARGYLSEDYQQKAQAIGMDRDAAFSEENLRKLREICAGIIRDFDVPFRQKAQELQEFLAGYGKTKIDSTVAKFARYRPGDKLDLKNLKTWNNALEDGRNAFSKEAQKRLGQADYDAVRERCVEMDAFLHEPYCLRRTAEILRGRIAVFHVADTLDRTFQALLKEKNVLGIEDTNSILKNIIAGSDAPFIYEKTGVRYRHFLLDEFQDTSTMQWENLRPLLANSIAEGMANLVVGDVKQSIYRWRSADWDILESRVAAELRNPVETPLEDNWRSTPEIVRFNNSFFRTLAAKMDVQLRENLRDSRESRELPSKSLSGIYRDVEQRSHDRIGVPGCVEVTLCANDELYDRTVEAVLEARERGFAWRDVAVIVRTHAVGETVATRLIARGVNVITNDSLKICSGRTVRMLVSELFRLDDPSDTVNGYYAGEFDEEALHSCQSLSDLAEALLRQMPADQVNADTLYVLAFLDLLRDFVARNGNSLHAFLQFWQEEGMARSISSPEGSDAVTVITIHKVKGLDYPYVVVPLPTKYSYILPGSRFWEYPDLEGTPLAGTEKAMYYTTLGEGSRQTLFRDNYLRELRMQYVDEMNVWYVAMTRASEAMHIITPMVKKADDFVPGGEWPSFIGVGAALNYFLPEFSGPDGFRLLDEEAEPDPAPDEGEESSAAAHFMLGEPCRKALRRDRGGDDALPIEQRILQYMPDQQMDTARSAVRIRTDYPDFFAAENLHASPRRRGSVLHKILETVFAPADLAASVRQAVAGGLLSASEAGREEQFLADAIARVADRGWFSAPRSCILDEREILVPAHGKSEAYRPDRVILSGDGVEIIDYKFGAKEAKHLRQIGRYAALYRALGYRNVRAFLWYVESGEIVPAED